MAEVRLTISGPVGAGKTAIAAEIRGALRALGVSVAFVGGDSGREAERMTIEARNAALDLYKPSVVIEERLDPSPVPRAPSGGGC